MVEFFFYEFPFWSMLVYSLQIQIFISFCYVNYLRIILNLTCTRKQNLHNDEVTTAALCTVLLLLIVYKCLQSKLLLGGPDTISQSTLHATVKLYKK
jgi:uncharacterized membrane protein (UPF0182 family)